MKAQVKEEPEEESLVQVQDQENKVYQTADDILRKSLSDRFAAQGRGVMGYRAHGVESSLSGDGVFPANVTW